MINKSEAEEKAREDAVPTYCIWCRVDCKQTEVIDTGEAWERWCYCETCKEESLHLIVRH